PKLEMFARKSPTAGMYGVTRPRSPPNDHYGFTSCEDRLNDRADGRQPRCNCCPISRLCCAPTALQLLLPEFRGVVHLPLRQLVFVFPAGTLLLLGIIMIAPQ